MRSFWYDNPGHSGFNSRRNPSFGISANGAGQSSGLEHQTRGAYRRTPVLSPSPSPSPLLLLITGQFPTNSRKGPVQIRIDRRFDSARNSIMIGPSQLRLLGGFAFAVVDDTVPLRSEGIDEGIGDRVVARAKRISEPNGTPVIRPLTGNIWLRPRGNEHGHDARSRVSSEAADCKCDIFSTSYGVPNRRGGSPRRIRLSNIDVNIARRLHITLRDVQRRIGCPGRSNGRTE